MKPYQPVTLVILDGWGHSTEPRGNAIAAANLPTINELDNFYPKTLLQASGIASGLPWSQFGNSEVGHQLIGTGQVVYESLPRISEAISDDSFFTNPALLKAMNKVKENNSRLHLLGLVSEGGIHSHLDHLLGLLELANREGLADKTFIHALMDGRDTSPTSGVGFLKTVIGTGVGHLATIAGRFFTMDRDNNWDRVKKGYDAMVFGQGRQTTDPIATLTDDYAKSISDENIEPTVITDPEGAPIVTIEDKDVIIFFNFRKDRARQITETFINPEFKEFPTKPLPEIFFVCMAQYDDSHEPGKNLDIAFPPQKIKNRLSEIVSKNDLKQLKAAETEKAAHVTFFFNGGIDDPFPKEERIIIPSPKVDSYATAPEMSAKEITNAVLEKIDSDHPNFITINYANPDMVGHTGDFEATIKAVETIDHCLDRLIKKVIALGGCLLITADHGNAEELFDVKTAAIDTKHSNNPVPCWFVTPDNRSPRPAQLAKLTSPQGLLIDISPTILELLRLPIPESMEGESLMKVLEK